jgi:hypothetical protein
MTIKNSKQFWLRNLLALVCGVVFSAGLVLSGMTQPAKVIGFLNLGGVAQGPFPGQWDPSLAFVMGGAVLVTLAGFAWTQRGDGTPWLAPSFVLPTRKSIDIPLVGGAVLFGIGWGLSGYCPGPALASVFTGGADALTFVGAMVVGMLAAKRWGRSA